jgi:3-deoxy-D-manno-octulosonate 8-phosphate phosphatase (KDO 8-P phosphatase)
MELTVADLDAIVFDFDGVLTDNHVYVHEDGTESVRCNRADGLALTRFGRPRFGCSSSRPSGALW